MVSNKINDIVYFIECLRIALACFSGILTIFDVYIKIPYLPVLERTQHIL